MRASDARYAARDFRHAASAAERFTPLLSPRDMPLLMLRDGAI
jgi:hypothetical protein